MITNKVMIVDGKTENVNFSVAVITKSDRVVLVILQGLECFIYHEEGVVQNYKRFDDESSAYMKWLYWIGKMCKKSDTSDYFLGTHKTDEVISVNDRCNLSISMCKISKYLSEAISKNSQLL